MRNSKLIISFLLLCSLNLLFAENVFIDRVRLTESPGEAGTPYVTRITIGKQTFQCLDLLDWKWMKNEWGFDAAAVIPQNKTALVGVRSEAIEDAKQQPITKMGPAAYEFLQKRWEAELINGSRKVERWVGDENSFDQMVFFNGVQGTQEFTGVYRYYFEDEKLITLGMICDKTLLKETQSVFAQFNGSFVKFEAK